MHKNRIEKLEDMIILKRNEIEEMTIDDACMVEGVSSLEFIIKRNAILSMLEWVMLAIGESK